MTVLELLKGAVDGHVTERQFVEEFFKFFRGGPPIPDAEAQCLSELVDDVNMAEHGGSLFGPTFIWRVEECLRLLSTSASASEIRSFFIKHRGP